MNPSLKNQIFKQPKASLIQQRIKAFISNPDINDTRQKVGKTRKTNRCF